MWRGDDSDTDICIDVDGDGLSLKTSIVKGNTQR